MIEPVTPAPRGRRGWLAETLRHESAAGVTVSAGALAAVVWTLVDEGSYQRVVNTTWNSAWLVEHNLGSLHSFVVNGLMVIFFFVVGLELSEEFRDGALQDRRAAILPIAAAVGGMVATAGTFVIVGELIHNHAVVRGWGVPTATDIAFTLGALAIVGRRVPSSLRVFLLTLAIADDLLAVLILAVAFQHQTKPVWLLGAAAIVGSLAVVRRRLPMALYVVALFLTWLFFVLAHVEPALAGVAVGLVVPFGDTPAGQRLERAAMPWSNGLVVPLFALCACGIAWSQLTWSVGLRQFLGSIIVARVVGKVVGITGVVYVGTRLGLKGPAGVSTKVMAAAAALCAVGFTVPLLFAEAVYGFDNSIYAAVTLGLLLASVVAGVIGVTSLRILTRRSGDSVV